MKVKITPKSITIPKNCPAKIFGDFDAVEVELENGHTVEFNLKEATVQHFVPESPMNFWLKMLEESIKDGDWRNVDRAITNLRIHHESKNHAQ